MLWTSARGGGRDGCAACRWLITVELERQTPPIIAQAASWSAMRSMSQRS